MRLQTTTAKVRLDAAKPPVSALRAQSIGSFDRILRPHRGITVANDAQKSDSDLTTTGNPGNVGLGTPLRGSGSRDPGHCPCLASGPIAVMAVRYKALRNHVLGAVVADKAACA
jgi:hypothetical protein